MKDKATFSHKPTSRTGLSPIEKIDKSPRPPEKISVRRIPLGEIVIYDIREDELAALVKDGHGSSYETWAVAALSTALSFLLFLLATSSSNILVVVFTSLMAFGFGTGIVLLFIALKERRTLNETVRAIKQRRSSLEDRIQ